MNRKTAAKHLQLRTQRGQPSESAALPPPLPLSAINKAPSLPSWMMRNCKKGNCVALSLPTYMLCIHSRTTLKDKSLVFCSFFFLLYYYSSLALSVRAHRAVRLACPLLSAHTSRWTRRSAVNSVCRWAAYHYKNTEEESASLVFLGFCSLICLSGTQSSPVFFVFFCCFFFCELQLLVHFGGETFDGVIFLSVICKDVRGWDGEAGVGSYQRFTG